MGGTGSFICIHAMMERVKDENTMDFFHFIKSSRIQCPSVVSNVVSGCGLQFYLLNCLLFPCRKTTNSAMISLHITSKIPRKEILPNNYRKMGMSWCWVNLVATNSGSKESIVLCTCPAYLKFLSDFFSNFNTMHAEELLMHKYLLWLGMLKCTAR